MAAAFKDLDSFFDPTLKLPVGGKTYVVPPPSAEVGLLCQRLMQASIAAQAGQAVDEDGLNELAEVVLNDEQEKDLYQTILGAAWDELLADKVAWPKVQHVGQTALIWVAAGLEAAAKHWESGPMGEAEAPTRTEASAAKSTRSRGSATTTTRTTASRGKAAGSRGKTS
ncbi:hypothetical protein AB0L53_31695 [Nonomuraea sp. NPDC052129]|uniref:DUF7426 family protein n=1 Tax=Nonomuraea sp. NPDC052129 TaxID=3154651 RepID=UPI00342A6DBD